MYIRVPSSVHSYTLCARSTSTKSARWYMLAHLPASPHAAPMWPAHLRSYAFRYTFLYVPDGLTSTCCTFL